MPTDHYFSAQPASDDGLRHVRTRLAGRDVEVVTAAGIFSPDGIDKGTRVLLDQAPAPPAAGTFLDLGCGWGPLALTLALESPDARVHAVDVNERALDLARRNAASLDCGEVRVDRPDDVDPQTRLDLIWSNPPIRVGKQALHELLLTWLPRLAEHDDAAAYLVVQKNLGADSLQTWLQTSLPPAMGPVQVTREASSKGFRVLRVARA
ncbi:16S rRNA methyltransferase [Serinicoccus sp. CNJ-927]|uniref:class I SAM-dependent methyltransferase n=1 Tax=Serinicoccus TaxID=265976 RepID=UPI0003B676EF|nr:MULTISPECIES: methyltransferase [Serinicoccus]OLT39212.1 16S rRNA methyltransferase [Serinicoccus sp. CNJ-927]